MIWSQILFLWHYTIIVIQILKKSEVILLTLYLSAKFYVLRKTIIEWTYSTMTSVFVLEVLRLITKCLTSKYSLLGPDMLVLYVGLRKAESSLAIELRTGTTSLDTFIFQAIAPFITSSLCSCIRKRQIAKHVLIVCLR